MKTLETNKIGIKAPQIYEMPAVEIFEIEVEKGFAVTDSPAPPDSGNPNMAPPPGDGGPWSGGPWH